MSRGHFSRVPTYLLLAILRPAGRGGDAASRPPWDLGAVHARTQTCKQTPLHRGLLLPQVSAVLAHAHACMPPPSSSCYSSRVQAKTRRQAEVAVGPIPIRGARTEIEPAMRSRTRWSVTRPGTGEPHGRRTAGRLVVVRQGPSFFPADLFVRPSVSDHWDLGYLLRFA
jgi:hypothetical protein